MKKLINIITTVFAIAGLLMCCSGQHAGITSQLIQNTLGALVFATAVFVGCVLNEIWQEDDLEKKYNKWSEKNKMWGQNGKI